MQKHLLVKKQVWEFLFIDLQENYSKIPLTYQ